MTATQNASGAESAIILPRELTEMSVYERALVLLQSGGCPTLMAFDLDYTIWPRDCDLNVRPPFFSYQDRVIDCFWRDASAYKDVADLLGAIVDSGIKVAFLSRNPSQWAVELLLRACPMNSRKLGPHAKLWDALTSRDYFHSYSSGGIGKGKDKHFAALFKLTAVDFKEIIFFDDLAENIEAANAQGSTGILVSKATGLDMSAFTQGLVQWRSA
jgi:magnesium-dependent phosphatase-1